DHVGGIDAALEPAVHAQPDHALEAGPGGRDPDSQGGPVAVAGGGRRVLFRSGGAAHGADPVPLHANAGRTLTAPYTIIFSPPKSPTSPRGGPRVKEPGRLAGFLTSALASCHRALPGSLPPRGQLPRGVIRAQAASHRFHKRRHLLGTSARAAARCALP